MQRMQTLDAMRGIAALLVVGYHLNGVLAIAPSGYLAVDFFFLLSGLVIAQTYDARLRSGLSLREFAIARLIRIYPLFALGLFIAVVRAFGQVKMQTSSSLTLRELGLTTALEAFMLPSPVRDQIFPLNGPAWSLFFEMAINLVYAAVAPRLSTRILAIAVVVAAVALSLCSFNNTGLLGGMAWSTFYIGIARVWFSFSMGILIFRFGWISSHRSSYLMLLPILLLVPSLAAHIGSSMRAVYDLVAVLLLFPLIVIAGARLNPPAVLSSMASFLGEISFPVYALHYPFLYVALYVMAKTSVSPIVWTPIFLVFMVLIGFAASRLYDVPVRRWLGKRRAPRRVVLTPTS